MTDQEQRRADHGDRMLARVRALGVCLALGGPDELWVDLPHGLTGEARRGALEVLRELGLSLATALAREDQAAVAAADAILRR